MTSKPRKPRAASSFPESILAIWQKVIENQGQLVLPVHNHVAGIALRHQLYQARRAYENEAGELFWQINNVTISLVDSDLVNVEPPIDSTRFMASLVFRDHVKMLAESFEAAGISIE